MVSTILVSPASAHVSLSDLFSTGKSSTEIPDSHSKWTVSTCQENTSVKGAAFFAILDSSNFIRGAAHHVVPNSAELRLRTIPNVPTETLGEELLRLLHLSHRGDAANFQS